MLEKGPQTQARLMFWEQPGYGVKQPKEVRREISSGSFEFRIRGVPERRIRMQTYSTKDGCQARAFTRIDEGDDLFERIDIEVSGWANVHRVEIHGLHAASGASVSEITHQD
jgi:hypothetical protein